MHHVMVSEPVYFTTLTQFDDVALRGALREPAIGIRKATITPFLIYPGSQKVERLASL